MGSWNVYDKEGTTVKCIVKSLEYSESFMGECFVTFTMKSPVPIDFKIGDYLIYRGERFEINYDPTELKKSAIRTSGEAFVYDSVKLNSLSDELVRCEFRDYVPNDNNIHFSSLPKFSFYASSISSLAERIQVNLDRIYNGDIRWTVEVHPEYVNKADVNISVDNINVWEALALVNSEFGANFIIRGRRIIIGTSGIPTDNLFEYGKGNGLVSIQRSAESDQNIITRLRAYGSERNMPARYYNKLSTGVPNNMAVNFLMLPGFPKETLDPYIDSPNITQLGIREGSVFFDGSGDMEEIYPSIEGMTDPIQGALDEVVSAEQIEDDGTVDGVSDNNNVPPFTITLKDIGFDINDYLSTETASISMKSGMCGGREFEIVKCERPKNDTTKWILTCNRDYDSALKIYFPYNDYNVKPGDKFALLGIEMPDKYVEAASQKLLSAAKGYLEKNDYVRYTYEPKIDDVYMARQHDEAIANGEESIHDTIKAGDIMLFSDSDIMVDGSVIIDNLTIKEGDGYIPKYEVTLRNEKVAGTIDKIQNQIDSIVSGGYNSAQIQSLIKTFGTRLFLRKDKEDIAQEVITFLKGINFDNFVKGATGAGIYKDGEENWHIESDYFHVRKKLTAEEVEIQRNSHIGGKLTNTLANCVCVEVVEYEEFYRCYFLKSDADGRTIYNQYKVDDQAYVETFNLQKQADGTLGNHFLWRLVVGVDDDTEDRHYIDLSKSDCADGSDAPQAGDDISQLGNRTDKTRQGAHVMSSIGNTPYYRIYNGIDSYTLPTPKIDLNPEQSQIRAKFISEATGEDIEKTINSLGVDVEAIKKQNDKQYILWFGTEIPTLLNYPAEDWDESEYESHAEDLFYLDNETDEENNGRAWRFQANENGAYIWNDVTDKYVLQCLKTASDAKKEAQTKKRVFVSQPTDEMEYDVGDLWVNATYKNADGTYLYEDDTLVCKVAKAAGAPFNVNHWKPASYGTKANIINTGEAIRLEVQASIDAMNDSLASLEVTVNSIEASVQNIHFDESGNIENISINGLVANADFSALVSQLVDADGNVVKKAQISSFVTMDDVEGAISNIELSADQINFIGKTIINGAFVVDEQGKLTLNDIVAVNGVYSGVLDGVTGTFKELKFAEKYASEGDFNVTINGGGIELGHYGDYHYYHLSNYALDLNICSTDTYPVRFSVTPNGMSHDLDVNGQMLFRICGIPNTTMAARLTNIGIHNFVYEENGILKIGNIDRTQSV